MAQIDSQLVEMESLTKDANAAKELTIQRLLKDGLITEEKAKEYYEKWQIIVIKRSWFQRWFNKFFGDGENADGYSFKLVKFED